MRWRNPLRDKRIDTLLEGQTAQTALLNQIISQGTKIMSDTTALEAALATNTAEVQAVAAQLAKLTATDADLLAQLKAAQASSDQPAIDAITAQLVANNNAMGAALPAPAPTP